MFQDTKIDCTEIFILRVNIINYYNLNIENHKQ